MKTIKEIANLSYDKSEENKEYSLTKWYNDLLDKIPDDISVEDVGLMLRQNVAVELGVNKAIEMIEENPVVGEKYEGEIVSALASLDEIPDGVKNKIRVLIPYIISYADNYDWELNDFKKEFLQDVKILQGKVGL